ncbi:MAG TPA: cation-transporting P-type ATPase [Acidobacteriota bacterium]|nr:cation-transporting P-type ATPase [Acidobacteriota bacterium]
MDKRRPFHSLSVEEALNRLEGNAERGLSGEEADERRKRHGPNRLRRSTGRSIWIILLDQFKSIVILLLVAAAVAAFATARWPEGLALVGVTLVNALIGFFSEWKAMRSMEAIRDMGRQTAKVRRQGEVTEIATWQLVPGDIVVVEGEDLVPADIRLLEAEALRVNEAALTGESVPVSKRTEAVDPEAPLAERRCMLYRGTSVAEGRGQGVVTATGMSTELGRISELSEQAQGKVTPLQKRLDDLGRRLAWITLGIAALVAAAGLASGQDPLLMIETAIALGVAAIPEGLPIVSTIALARGMWLMARRNALVHRLTAVETLGATTVIFTDKTGTLTENRMELQSAVTPRGRYDLSSSDGPRGGEKDLRRLMRIGALCSNAVLESEDNAAGDPTEIALLAAARRLGMERQSLLESMPEVREESFDPDVMMMATFHQDGDDRGEDRYYVAVKGAPGAVLKACTHMADADGKRPLDDQERQEWQQRADDLAGEGLRLLALADKQVRDLQDDPYQDLCLVGLACLLDPARQEVRESIDRCQAAGIRAVMVTGDQASTAAAIGKRVGLVEEHHGPPMQAGQLEDIDPESPDEDQRLLETRVFARVTPEQKLRLIRLYQERGEIVAMTGDGVNDAPALKQADIGVAMGGRGTDAAKQVADMVLRDDAFSTIVTAVRQGRITFANIRKSVMFMLCTNIAEILAVTAAALAQAPIPLLPLQILYLNVLTDVFPGLALGLGPGSDKVMDLPPRDPRERVLTRHHWRALAAWSSVIAICVLAGLSIALAGLGFERERAITVSFLTLAFAKLWFVLNLRDRDASALDNDITRNPWIWAATALCVALLLAAVYWPPLAGLLDTRPPGSGGWTLILSLSFLPALLGLFAPKIRFAG